MKKFIYILLTLVSITMLAGCQNASDVVDQVVNLTQAADENVLMVKNATNSNYPDITYGEAFENFFAQPTWKYYLGTINQDEETETNTAVESTIDNTSTENITVDVVEFTGYCTYQDVEVKALIQFILNKEEGTFTAEYLSFNDVPQNNLVLISLLTKVFETAMSERDTLAETSNNVSETAIEDVTSELVTTSENSKQLIGTFTQVGLYEHDAYIYLDPEYVPTVYLYDDNTFKFHCNFYSYIGVFEGSWQVEEDEAVAKYHFMVENDPSLPNLDFYITHNKARCDADFWSDYNEGSTFGMTSIEEVLFHPDF